VCGIALLGYALAGFAVTILLMYQQAPPGIEAEAEGRIHVGLGVVAVCTVSGLLGIVMSRVSWQHSSELLLSAEPVTTQSVQRSSGTWDWIWAGMLAVIGMGMVGAFTERSFIDLSLGTVFLANFGSATLALAGRVRRLEHIRHVRYYCLAISLRSWRMVWIRQ
jgi:hypothetical protein